jgi:hypothetical protein
VRAQKRKPRLLFRSYACPENREYSGYSEWFEISALGSVIGFLEQHQVLCGHKKGSPVSPPVDKAQRTKAQTQCSIYIEGVETKNNSCFFETTKDIRRLTNLYSEHNVVKSILVESRKVSMRVFDEENADYTQEVRRTEYRIIHYLGDEFDIENICFEWSRYVGTSLHARGLRETLSEQIIELPWKNKSKWASGMYECHIPLPYEYLRGLRTYGGPSPFVRDIAEILTSMLEPISEDMSATQIDDQGLLIPA